MIKFDVRVNELLLDSFKAKLLDYQVGDSAYNNGYILPPSSVWPISLNAKKGLRPITISLDFIGESRYEIELAISNMKAILHQGADILLPDGFYYYSVYESCSAANEVAPWIVNVQFSLSGIRHGAMKTQRLSESGNIFVDGNSDTPAIFKVNSRSATASINDITITKMKSQVIIDGIEKTVTENGVNKFSDTDMTDFPLLKNGNNTITISSGADLEISYYPIFL